VRRGVYYFPNCASLRRRWRVARSRRRGSTDALDSKEKRPESGINFMKARQNASWACLALVVLSLVACSRNANQYAASGDKYFAAGRYNEAVIQYRNAVQINPKLVRAHYQLSQAYLRLRSIQAAYNELRETVALDPSNSDAQLQLATLLIASKKYDEAKAAATKVLKTQPNNVRAHQILGDQSALTGDFAGATREFRTAIKLDPGRLESYSSLAAVYASRSQFADAEAVLKEAIEANPKSSRARVNLGSFYFSQRKFAAAEAEMVSASKLAPSDPLPRLMLANSYAAEGNFAEGEKICKELKTIAPADPSAYHALALFYESTGQRTEAVKELQSLQASHPKDPWVKANLAETLLDLDRVQEASVPTQELLSLDPSDPVALLLKGRILITERKYPEARTALENAVKGAPGSAASYYFLGVAQQSLGLADAAKVSFAQAHSLSPRMVGPEAALAELDVNSGAYDEAERLANTNANTEIAAVVGAQVELAKGNLGKAEQQVEAALQHDPVSLPALEVLVKLYARDGKAQEAVRRLSALTSQHPKNAGLQFLLGLSYFSLKDLQKAEASARQAVALDAQTPDAHALLAAIDQAKGLKEQAITDLRAEIEANPYKVSNYMALANLYGAEGKWQDARSLLEKAHAVDPSSASVKNDLAYLYLQHGGDTNAALSLAQEAKRALPDSPAVADTLGWALYKLGSYQLAINQLTASAQKVPDNPEYQYHLGMAYLAAGSFGPSAQSLQRALSSDPKFLYAENAKAALETIAKRSRK
jgi:tetratricopeptide (TPR) repeat protein